MSLWDNVKKFAQPYSDDEYDDYDEEEEYEEEYEQEPAPRRAQRSTRRSAPVMTAEPDEDDEDHFSYESAPAANLSTTSYSGVSTSGFSGQVLNMNTSGASSSKQEVVLFRPVSFNDTSKAADDLRSHKAVVCNMENVDKAMARRVVDFLSGCVYALDGDVRKIAQSAYLFCPHNMEVVGDLESIQAEVESYI